MSKPLTEPATLLAGITHREMLDAMADSGIFCSVDKFRRVLDWAQRRALASRNTNEETEPSLASLITQEAASED